MKLEFTESAISDVDGVFGYIAESNPSAAEAVVHRIDSAIQGLLQFPKRGREGRVSGTRELVVPGLSHLVAYTITEDRIEVPAVLHGARAWPASFQVKP